MESRVNDETNGGWVDLHAHTTASDGSLSPESLVALAAGIGLRAVAVTDHDSVSGVFEGLAAGSRLGIEVVPGIEIGIREDAERDLVDVDILGYFVDPSFAPLLAALARIRESRHRWVREQIALLADAGFAVPESEVWDEVGRSPTPRRPHVRKVVERRYPGALSTGEFFRRTDFGGDLHVAKTYEMELEECVALLRAAGGVPVLAHPEDYPKIKDKERLVETCARAGIQGIESYYPYSLNRLACAPEEDAALAERYLAVARTRGLAPTGGSDFHGDYKPRIKLGMMNVPRECLDAVRRRASKAPGAGGGLS